MVIIDSDKRVLEIAFMMLSHPLQHLISSSTALVYRWRFSYQYLW